MTLRQNSFTLCPSPAGPSCLETTQGASSWALGWRLGPGTLSLACLLRAPPRHRVDGELEEVAVTNSPSSRLRRAQHP